MRSTGPAFAKPRRGLHCGPSSLGAYPLRNLPALRLYQLRCVPSAVKERETLSETEAAQKGKRKPDMNAALTSASSSPEEKNSRASSRPLSQSQPAEEPQERESVKKQVLFGPSSRLTNAKAIRKRKQPQSSQSRQQPASSAAKRGGTDDTEGSLDQRDSLDNLNPYTMGRRSRLLLDAVWQKFTNLGAPGRVSVSSNELDRVNSISGSTEDFETPQATFTTVLVLGATGKVGRILVRKLLLRGYPVTVLVRPDSPNKSGFPEAVRIVEGDVGNYTAVRSAMEGADKVIYCADARSTLTVDVKRVCEDGVLTVAKALQDERNNGISASPIGVQPFPSAKKRIAGGRQSDTLTKRKARWLDWKVIHVGQPVDVARSSGQQKRKYAPPTLDRAELLTNKRRNLLFKGTLYTRSAYATAGMPLDMSKEGLTGTVGLVVRVKGDGQTYGVVLTTDSGQNWMARFGTNKHFQNVRIPYSAFRRTDSTIGERQHALDPTAVRMVSLSFENRNRQPAGARGNGLAELSSQADREFALELNRIHALPDGAEADFILVSCAGVPASGMDPLEQEKIVSFKRRGEAALRTSGLGYTVIRPGPIIEEPGGYKALVFDQGDRIKQSISRADVADVCLKSLHDAAARNKTFEVCHEYAPASGLETYELVAHLPNKANSYLAPALSTLERET